MKDRLTAAIVTHFSLNFKVGVLAALAKRIVNRGIVRRLKTLTAISGLVFVCGCLSMNSPYDLHDWCVNMGSPRLASIGPEAQDRNTCQKQLDEDLADPTPRILYVPRDVVMSPVITARAVWVFFGRTRPPF